jgi:hypothetical protein
MANEVEAEAKSAEQKALPKSTMKQFLEDVPPSQVRFIANAIRRDNGRNERLQLPAIELHCPKCVGVRVFRVKEEPYISRRDDVENEFLEFVCSNCRVERKRYSLAIIFEGAGDDIRAFKYGELPAFGQPTPPRLLELLGDQRGLFLKGRRCEFQGLGIGAFTYYRRVVESQKARIFDEIIKAAKRLSVKDEDIQALIAARDETQFSKSISMVKDAIPQALLVQGHNPLTLLHSALSDGLHDRTDEHCLDLAQEIRVVLADLAERISQVLKDHAELKTAISRLMARDTK